jgi:hypothetical protein
VALPGWISVARRRRLEETARGDLAAVCLQPALRSCNNVRQVRHHAAQCRVRRAGRNIVSATTAAATTELKLDMAASKILASSECSAMYCHLLTP